MIFLRIIFLLFLSRMGLFLGKIIFNKFHQNSVQIRIKWEGGAGIKWLVNFLFFSLGLYTVFFIYFLLLSLVRTRVWILMALYFNSNFFFLYIIFLRVRTKNKKKGKVFWNSTSLCQISARECPYLKKQNPTAENAQVFWANDILNKGQYCQNRLIDRDIHVLL